MKCAVWLLDSGAESLFINSLGSLKLNARDFWDDNIKLILDFGLSEKMATFLSSLSGEHVYVHRLTLPDAEDVVGANPGGGVGVMRRRVEISRILQSITESLKLTVEEYVIYDCDTVFFFSPVQFPMPGLGRQIIIMKEWDISNGVEVEMKICRPSSFAGGSVPTRYIPLISSKLGLTEREFISIPTYNTGVFGFRAGVEFSQEWETAYTLIKTILDDQGVPIFSPFAAEQNALSLCVYKGAISISDLPKRFNQFPPRPPLTWPEETVIGHFITFNKNHEEDRYKLWYKIRNQLLSQKFIPEGFIH